MKQALTMQHGFTLIEALIAVALLGLVVIGTLGATITFSRRAAAFAEAGELEERRSVLIDTLQADVDQAGRSLSITSTYGSGTEASIFFPDPYYSSTLSGTSTSLQKTGPSGWNHTSTPTRELLSSPGSVSAQLIPGSEVAIYNTDNTLLQNALIIQPGESTVSVVENGIAVATIGSVQSGDSYRIAEERDPSGNLVVNYYRTRSGAEALQYTSGGIPLNYPIGIFMSIYDSGATLANCQISSAVLADLQPTISLPPLPVDVSTGQRLAGPITITVSGGLFSQAVVIAGDSIIDPVYTTASYDTTSSPVTLVVTPPRRGSLSVGDYLLLIDPRTAARASCLYRLASATPAGTSLALTVEAMTGNGAAATAWYRLYSPPSDFARTYPAGSAVVRIQPLVTYTLANGILVRTQSFRSGSTEGQQAATLAPGIAMFAMQAATTGTIRAYTVSVTATTEGYETGSRTEDMNFTITPRSLTKAEEWVGQTP
jgi:prepilin-type N-terminal cleavage/methylation domain-containing protein